MPKKKLVCKSTTRKSNAGSSSGAAPYSGPMEVGEFFVDKILNKRYKNGRWEFLLKWQGYPIEEASWEPRRNIHAIHLLDEFEDNAKERKDLPNHLVTRECEVLKILGISRENGRLEFLVKYSDQTLLLVPAKYACARYPLRLVEFYERNFAMIPDIDELRAAAKKRRAQVREEEAVREQQLQQQRQKQQEQEQQEQQQQEPQQQEPQQQEPQQEQQQHEQQEQQDQQQQAK